MAVHAVPLIHTSRAIEFAASPIDAFSQQRQEADCLVTPVADLSEKAGLVVINGNIQPVEPFIAGALAKAIKVSHELQSQNLRVDCSAFAVLLCSGYYRGVTKDVYDESTKAIDYRQPAVNSRHKSIARIMEPLQLADPFLLIGKGSVFWPKHTVVPISHGHNLYAHKFGEGPIAVTGLETAARHYGTSLLAAILRMDFMDHAGSAFLQYRAANIDGITASETYRFNSR